MKRILLAGATLLALTTAQPVLAADAPVYKGPAPYAAAPAYKWTGCYLGLQAGLASARTSGEATNGAVTQFLPYSYNATGGLFGAHVGCDMQFAPSIVIGIEADWNWAGLRGRQDGIEDPINFPGLFYTHRTTIDSLGSIHGRFGVLVTPSTLLYATAGWAFGHTVHSLEFTGAPPPFISYAANRSGWSAGLGLETYIMPQVTARLVYRFSRLNGGTVGIIANTIDNLNPTNIHAVMVGLTWRP